MIASRRYGCVLIACAALLLSQSPQTAQDLSQVYAGLAIDSGDLSPDYEIVRKCGTSFDLLEKTATGFTTVDTLTDGRPLRADQFPRFMRPSHSGDFGLTNFLVLGDFGTVTFERVDPDNENEHVDETWTRTGTEQVAGRLVSVFNPVWNTDTLHQVLRRFRVGVDQPYLFWGEVVVPGTGLVASAPGTATDHENGEAERVGVYLAFVPPNIPSSQVMRINDEVQFASHSVNIWDPDFGDSRVNGGDTELNETEITQKFYEHFEDQYDTIAIVSQAMQLADFFGFHGNVKNEIGGIGLDLFDNSAQYGSSGVLKGVEGYPPGGWATWSTVLHEQAHQWNEYTKTWSQVGPPPPTVSTAIDRKGHGASAHTPLLYPGEVTVGAVLEAERRVKKEGGAYTIERTMPLINYNPLTLYRMGHTPAGQLPTYQVFLDQGQFDAETSVAPDVGVSVEGERVEVTVNDMMAADGTRTGPTVTSVRRALVYVSRAGLVPKEEMDVINYFAKRLGESSGVTAYDRYPSFAEATGGRPTMTTDITPKSNAAATLAAGGVQSAAKIEPGPDVRCANVGTNALIGVTLDNEIPGCLRAPTTITVAGTLTLTDRIDYNTVCFRFRRYGADDANEIFTCSTLNGNRFSIDFTFNAQQAGTYSVQPFAFWPDSGSQFARSIFSSIEVLAP